MKDFNNTIGLFPQKVGTVDNTTLTFQDSNFGTPSPPTTAPEFVNFNINGTSGGSFIGGNSVSYAFTFVNENGESIIGPWCDWVSIPQYSSVPHIVVGTDPTVYLNSPTLSRNIYRKFLLSLNNGQSNQYQVETPMEFVGSIPENTTGWFDDSNLGPPMPPMVAPGVATQWAQDAPSGGFVSGNNVYYAVTFVNQQGESLMSPWSAAIPIDSYALPEINGMPTDYSPLSGTTSRNVYRCFSINRNGINVFLAPQYVGSINDATTETFQDGTFYGAPNPPADSPSINGWGGAGGGMFIEGNLVSYAQSFVAADGEESILGPWSAWQAIPGGGASCPNVITVMDPNQNLYKNNPTTKINIYRCFQINYNGTIVETPQQLVLTLDATTASAYDGDLGAPMPAINAPSGPNSWLQSAPSGGFVAGSMVTYAVSYLDAFGHESLIAGWSPLISIDSNSLPQINIPVDSTPGTSTISRNIYRVICPPISGVQNASVNRNLSKRDGSNSAVSGSITVNYIKCITASNGLSSTFDYVIGSIELAGAVVAGIGGFVAIGAPPAGAIIAAIGGGVYIIASGTAKAANWIGQSSDDNVYLKINNSQYWPASGNIVDMGSDDKELVNITVLFDGPVVTLEIWDKDSWSSDDCLVSYSVDITTLGVDQTIGQFPFQIVNSNENSVYEISMTVTRTS